MGYISYMDIEHMYSAVDLAFEGMKNHGGGPFGAVVVKDGKIIGQGHNSVTATQDPTAHAEIMAIREACKALDHFQLTGCDLYTTCEPCPMCLGAIYWARPDRVYYACTKEDAANAGFDDAFVYKEIDLSPESRQIPFIPVENKKALKLFQDWVDNPDRTEY